MQARVNSGVAGSGWSSPRIRATFRSLHLTGLRCALRCAQWRGEGARGREGGGGEGGNGGGEVAHYHEAAPETEAILNDLQRALAMLWC